MSSSSSSSKLAELRATMESLQSFELPSKFLLAPAASESLSLQQTNDDKQGKVLDDETVERYKRARDEYIHRRMLQVFYDHIGTLHNNNNENNQNQYSFDLPQLATPQQQQELDAQLSTVQQELYKTAATVTHSQQALIAKYTAFCARRHELANMMDDIQQQQETDAMMDDDDDDIGQDEFTYQGQHLAQVTQRKAELQLELEKLKAETQVALERLESTKAVVQDLRTKRTHSTSTPRSVSPIVLQEQPQGDDTNNDATTNSSLLQAETASIRKKVDELQEMSAWYGGLCQVMEELGGIQLLSVEQAQPEGVATDKETNTENAAIVLHVQLLGKHKVDVTMSPWLSGSTARSSAATTRSSAGSSLHVTHAKFVSSTLISSSSSSSSSGSSAASSTTAPGSAASTRPTPVQMHIPALDDLVRLVSSGSIGLQPAEDLRFVLREAMARIRTITARVDELAWLKTRYLTKIGSLHAAGSTGAAASSFGGQDQEIVCSLNEGITAVLRLSPDCPMMEGSIVLDQIVGVGGWDMDVLDKIKDRVNNGRNHQGGGGGCKGPLAMMDALTKEIRRVQQEDGVVLPKTPTMPSRK